jgi:hypothetical protein
MGVTRTGMAPAPARFRDEDLEVLLVGGERLDVGLRPVRLLVVMAELHEQVIALLHLAQNLVEPQSGDERLERLAGFGVVGNRHAGLEEAGQHLPPARVGSRGWSVTVESPVMNTVGMLSTLSIRTAVHAGPRVAEFETSVCRPSGGRPARGRSGAPGRRRARSGRRRNAEVAHVDHERAGLELPGGRGHFLQHEPSRLGFDGVDRLAGRIAEGDRDAVVALRHRDRKEERLVAGDRPGPNANLKAVLSSAATTELKQARINPKDGENRNARLRVIGNAVQRGWEKTGWAIGKTKQGFRRFGKIREDKRRRFREGKT